MLRRRFIERLSLGTGSLALSRKLPLNTLKNDSLPDFSVKRIEDLFSSEGMLMIRFNYTSGSAQSLTIHQGAFKVKKASIAKIRSYFFNSDYDEMDYNLPGIRTESYPGSEDVIVIWIKNAEPVSEIRFPVGEKEEKFDLKALIENAELEFQDGKSTVNVSYLLDKEIGKIKPEELGITAEGNSFSFTVMADPQGGNPETTAKLKTRMRIHNAFIDESVRLVNELDPKPAFNIVIGDIVDGQGHRNDFRAMNDTLSKVSVPTLYGIGNHETEYKSVFSPGYNMDAFSAYFAAQKEFNGMDKLLYSFDLGEWHFIVWPDPLRSRFWETHPHYFAWLEDDLKKHRDRPTIFFQHVPIHPIGIVPLINYAESVDVKRLLIDILSKHANVKYVLSGHVHIPMRASVKTSVEINGMKLINLPAAGYRPRAFGEEDFNGGPTQGIAIVKIKGKEASLSFTNVVNESFEYPEPKEFKSAEFPLWYKHKWELAEKTNLENGDFRQGLKYWNKRYVYMEDVHPSNICEVRNLNEQTNFLYLRTRTRGYHTPGQDRLPQTINRICQVINVKDGCFPKIELDHWLDPEYHIPYSYNGTFIWIEGFERGLKRMNVVYSTDHVFWNLGGMQSQIKTVAPVQMEITRPAGKWRKLILNPVRDFMNNSEKGSAEVSGINTLAITLGTWTLNEGFDNKIAAAYANIGLQWLDNVDIDSFISSIDSLDIERKAQKYFYWKGIVHNSGEHQSVVEDLNKYIRKTEGM